MNKYLLFLFATLTPLLTSAYNIDNIYYNLDSKTKSAEVTNSPSKYSGSITIPNTVTFSGVEYKVNSIGKYAFYSCNGLTSIEIPNSVTSIGEYAFSDCSGLTSIVVAEGNAKYDSRENCNAIIETATNALVAGCKNTIIPNSVTSIGDWAFSGCDGLTSIEIPNSVTSIGNYAFYGCSGLTSIEIPNSVTSIGEWAFGGCPGLTSITIPNSVASIKNGAFYCCKGLTSITIPNSVTSIGEQAFGWCTGLTSIEIPNSVTSIGDWAFENCDGLTSVTIGNSVTSIGDWAFSGCSGLTSIEIPNSVTSIGDWAFIDCYGLTNVTIGNSVTSIGEEAFVGCTGLTSIQLLSKTPPTVESGNFAESHITLYVPVGSLETYQTADTWKNFWDIQEFDATAIENIEEVTPAFEITSNGIQFTAADSKTVAIYTVAGALVEKIDSYTGEEITLNKGVYIVRVDGMTIKIRL